MKRWLIGLISSFLWTTAAWAFNDQTTSGLCSPAVRDVQGNVTINCQGLSDVATKTLNELLNKVSEIKDLLDIVSEKEKRLAEVEQRLSKKDETIDKRDDTISKLNDEKSQLESDIKALQTGIETEKLKAAEEWAKRFRELQERLVEYEQDLAKTTREVADATEKNTIQHLNQMIKMLNEKIAQLENEKTQLLTTGIESGSMSKLDRFKGKKAEYQRSYQRLSEKLTSLQEQYDLETRVEEKLRLGNLVEKTQSERDAVEKKIEALESEMASSSTQTVTDGKDVVNAKKRNLITRDTLENTDIAKEITIPDRNFLIGVWLAERFEFGLPTKIVWYLNRDGSESYEYYIEGKLIRDASVSGTWYYEDGIIYENFSNGLSGKGLVRFVSPNHFELTIIDNKIAHYRGMKRDYYKQEK